VNYLLLLVVIALMPFAALAQQAPPAQPATVSLLDEVVKFVAAVVAAALLLLIKRAATYFHEKTKIEIPAATEAMLEDWAQKAVNYAQEKSHQAIQANAGKLTGPAKLDHAVQFAMDLAKEIGID
jgi:hypothetical protein